MKRRMLALLLALFSLPALAQLQLNNQQLGTSLNRVTAATQGSYFSLPAFFPNYTWQTVPSSATAISINLEGSIDGRQVADAAMTASSATLSSASGAFTVADVGKVVYVNNAGTSGATLITTIASVTNATTAVLSAAASRTVSGAGAMWGTWAVLDNSTTAGGEVRHVVNKPVKYLRCNLISLTGTNASAYITVYK
jgi:hypothetical protein